MTFAQFQEIRGILAANAFTRRDRSGDGPAELQGLIVCGRCGGKLRVKYRGNEERGHEYCCAWRSIKYGEKICLHIEGGELERAVERQLFALLRSPAKEVLTTALEEARRAEKRRLLQVEAQRQRLEHHYRLARERWENCDPKYHLVFAKAQEELQQALEELEEFKRSTAREHQDGIEGSEEELEELCALVSEIPGLWRERDTTHRDRKEILRAVIDRVTVEVTPETAEGMIHWKGGQKTPYRIYRRRGRYRLLKELHREGLNCREIVERLAKGITSTGQRWVITESMVYLMLRKLDLQPHRFSSEYRAARQTARELYQTFQDLEKTASELNRQGLKTLFGDDWTPKILRRVIKPQNQRRVCFEALARKAYEELNGRNLSDQKVAEEFNARGVPRWNGGRWMGISVRHLRQRMRRDESLENTKPPLCKEIYEKRIA